MRFGRLQKRASLTLVLLGMIAAVRLPMSCLAYAADSATRYHVSQRWPLAGAGGWNFIFVSDHNHRLYVPRDTRITVVDTNSGLPVAEIKGLTDARGIALDPEDNVAYVTDGITGTLKVFSLSTLNLTSSVTTGGAPEAVVFEPTTRHIFTFDTHTNAALVIDPSSFQITQRIKLPGRPTGASVDGKGSVFVNLESTSQVARIDARTFKLQETISLAPCVGPSGIALDLKRSYVFSTCENKMMAVTDGSNGKLVATIPVGEGAKTVGFDERDELVFSANADGTLSVIKEDAPARFIPVQTVATEPGARIMTFDSDRQQLYLLSSKFGQRTEPTSEELQFRPTPVPGSAVVLVIKP